MDSDEIARIAYLAILGLGIGGYYIAQRREGLGKTAQYAALWGLIFVGVIAAYGLWSDVTRTAMPGQQLTTSGQIEIPLDRDGHYRLTLAVNGVSVGFLVDTGASQIVLSQRDAARIGIDIGALTYLGAAQTANGIVRTAHITLGTVALEGVTQFDVRAVVNEGQLGESLLGMAYLGQFGSVVITPDRMVLSR